MRILLFTRASSTCFSVLVLSTLVTCLQHTIPSSYQEFRSQYPYHYPPPNNRHRVNIRPSANSTDDVSADLLRGLQLANNGGTLVLPANQTFVIGTKLDLTFLNDVQVQLDGEILVRFKNKEGSILSNVLEANVCSSLTTSPTGKIITSTILSKNPSHSGSGAAKTS